MSVELLTKHHLEFLGLKGGCTGSSESTLVKMPNCWKSHVTAQMVFAEQPNNCFHIHVRILTFLAENEKKILTLYSMITPFDTFEISCI